MLSTFPREFSPENILVPATKHLRLRTTDEPGKNVIAANITELVIRILHKIGRRGHTAASKSCAKSAKTAADRNAVNVKTPKRRVCFFILCV